MRFNKVLTAAGAFALLNLATQQWVPTLERPEQLLLLTLAALLITSGLARGVQAAFSETVAGFAAALTLTLESPGWLWLALLFVAPGVFLAPVLSGPVRRNAEIAVPAGQVAAMAAGLLGVLALLVGIRADWEMILTGVAMLMAVCQVVAASAAVLLTLIGKPTAGVWIGAVSGLAFLVAFVLVLDTLMQSGGGQGFLSTAGAPWLWAKSAPSAWPK